MCHVGCSVLWLHADMAGSEACVYTGPATPTFQGVRLAEMHLQQGASCMQGHRALSGGVSVQRHTLQAPLQW